MSVIDFTLSLNIWYAQLMRIPKILFLISIFVTPIAGYFYDPDETKTILGYAVNAPFRLGFMMLVFFISDFFRTYYQTYKLRVVDEE